MTAGMRTDAGAIVRLVAGIAFTAALGPAGSIPAAHAGLPDVVERIKPSVVAVGTFQRTRNPAFVFRATGFVVGDGTLIATAAHALPENLQSDALETIMIFARLPGESEPQRRTATAVASDKVHDVALLRITGAPLPPVTFGNPGAVRDGQGIAFTGFPLGNSLGFHPVTLRGIVASQPPIALPSATAGQLDEKAIRGVRAGAFVLFQLDTAVYPGHSGSPLYDADTGQVVGIVDASLRTAKDAALGPGTGITFAVPAQYLQELIRSVR
jgi:serine protease Do